MDIKIAKKLLALPDRELATVANRYKYNPLIVTLTGDGKVKTEKAPDWAKAWLDGWSDIESTHKFLEEQLGVKYVKDTYEGHSDGGYEPNYTSRKFGKFKFYGNYYDFDCFIPVLRWALKSYIGVNK